MSYGINLTQRARVDLAHLPRDIRRLALMHIEFLGRRPTELSTPLPLPFVEVGQVYSFQVTHEQQAWDIRVMFQYGADEQTIHILSVRHEQRPSP